MLFPSFGFLGSKVTEPGETVSQPEVFEASRTSNTCVLRARSAAEKSADAGLPAGLAGFARDFASATKWPLGYLTRYALKSFGSVLFLIDSQYLNSITAESDFVSITVSRASVPN